MCREEQKPEKKFGNKFWVRKKGRALDSEKGVARDLRPFLKGGVESDSCSKEYLTFVILPGE